MEVRITAFDKGGNFMQGWADKGLLRYLQTKKKPLANGTELLQWQKVIPHLGRGLNASILTELDLFKYRSMHRVFRNQLQFILRQ